MHGMINQSGRSNFQGCRLPVPSTFNFKFLWHHSQKFHPCLPQYHTKRVIVDISPQSSDYSTKFLQYRPRKVFTVGESKMTNVTFSNCITTYRAMTNTLLYAIKRMQHSCDLKIYSSEEPAKVYSGKMWSQLSWLHRTWRQRLHRLWHPLLELWYQLPFSGPGLGTCWSLNVATVIRPPCHRPLLWPINCEPSMVPQCACHCWRPTADPCSVQVTDTYSYPYLFHSRKIHCTFKI